MKLLDSLRLLLLVSIALAAWPAVSAGDEDTISVEEKIAGLALVWQEANYSFAFFDRVPDLDWDAEFINAIGRVTATQSDFDYVREIQRFVALLGEAHTNVEPGKRLRARFGGHPAIELDEIERQAVVVNASQDLADAAPLGSVILAVDGVPVDEYLADRVFPYMSASTEHYRWRQSIRGHWWRAVGLLVGEVGSTVTLAIATPAGDERELRLERLPGDADIDWLHPKRADKEVLTYRRLDDDILYFALNTFNSDDVVTRFEAHLEQLATARAVVLDIRQNGGGSSRRGWNIGRYFSDTPLEVSHWKTRMHLAAYKAWGRHSDDPEKKAHAEMNAWDAPAGFSTIDPPEHTFAVPVAVLIGSSTYSAAEDFLACMRAVPHCIFVGGPSAGSTGQPLSFEIPGGAWVGITSKYDTMPDGTEFVGYGVKPDIEVHQTLAAHRQGRDLVLERAVAALQERAR